MKMKPLKEQTVREFFEQPEVYLKYDYNLSLRRETIATFIGDEKFEDVLDMPCGTGDLSLPFIDQFNHLMMMDFSSNMIAHAAEKVPEQYADRVKIVNANFYNYGFEEQQFDLIIAVGILAHIDFPMKFLMQIGRLVKPGGKIIVQNTNASAGYTWLIRMYHGLKRLTGKSKYKLNWLREKDVIKALRHEGFEVVHSFRYHQSWLGFSHLFSNEKKYEMTRKRFGTAAEPRNQKSGSDVMYCFEKNR